MPRLKSIFVESEFYVVLLLKMLWQLVTEIHVIHRVVLCDKKADLLFNIVTGKITARMDLLRHLPCAFAVAMRHCAAGRFGADCSGVCRCLALSACRSEDGRCTDDSCQLGWTNPPYCQTGTVAFMSLRLLIFWARMTRTVSSHCANDL